MNKYYTQDQACAKLGLTVEEIKLKVRDGLLSEVRDGRFVFYKVSEIDNFGKSDVTVTLSFDMPQPIFDCDPEPEPKPSKPQKFSYRAFCKCGWSIYSSHASEAYIGTSFYSGKWCPKCGNPGPEPCSKQWVVKKVVWKSHATLLNPLSWFKGEWIPVEAT